MKLICQHNRLIALICLFLCKKYNIKELQLDLQVIRFFYYLTHLLIHGKYVQRNKITFRLIPNTWEFSERYIKGDNNEVIEVLESKGEN